MKVKLSGIRKHPDNPRLIKDADFQSLKKSIILFPEMQTARPIVVNKDNLIIGGNQRFGALKDILSMSLDEISAVIGTSKSPIEPERVKFLIEYWDTFKADKTAEIHKVDWDEAKQKEFMIKDNVSNGEWDFDELANNWDSLELNDWGVGVWEQEEPEKLEAKEDDYEEPETVQTDIVIGDLITFEKDGKEIHRLLCGDSTDSEQVAKLMNGEKADMVITDLPYGVSYADKNVFLNQADKGNRNQAEIENDHVAPAKLKEFCKSVYTSILPFISAVNSYYAFMPQGGEQMMMMMALSESGYKVKHELIWLKNNHVLGRADYNYKHEPICYGWTVKGTHKFYGGFKTSILEFPKPQSSKEHPTMKPIALLSELVNNSSQPNDLLLDPTIGSGSTMVAAHQLNRKCYGMELEPKYCQVIIDRMQKLDSGLVVKINGSEHNQ